VDPTAYASVAICFDIKTKDDELETQWIKRKIDGDSSYFMKSNVDDKWTVKTE
jgi:hypothetical protein